MCRIKDQQVLMFLSAHIFHVENSESNGAPFSLISESKYLCGHKGFNNDCFNVSNQTII